MVVHDFPRVAKANLKFYEIYICYDIRKNIYGKLILEVERNDENRGT